MALDANALTTWAMAQLYLAPAAADQSLIESLINAASAEANRDTGRLLKSRTHDKILNGTGSAYLLLPEWPATLLSHLYIDEARVFGADTEVQASEYLLDQKAGTVTLYDRLFPAAAGVVKAQWTGGLGAAGGDEVPLDLQLAVLDCVQWTLSRARGQTIGIRTQTNPDGALLGRELIIPESARRVFEDYRRR